MAEDSEPAGDDQHDDQGGLLLRALDKAIEFQQPKVAERIKAYRESHPGTSPVELCRWLERSYLATVTGSGAAVGASAAAPGVGTGVALALTAGETVASLEASVLLVLCRAEVHGMDLKNLERRRTLLLATLLGNSGPGVIQKVAGRTGKHWANLLLNNISGAQLSQINRILGRNFVTKYGTKQGILVLGRVAPFGIGAALGGAGNAAVGYGVIKGVHRAFGPPPEEWPSTPDRGSERPDDPDDAPTDSIPMVVEATRS